MASMITSLENERRAKSMVRRSSRDKLVAKEYTAPVRAANSCVTRSCESTLKKVDEEWKTFRDRHSKSIGNVRCFGRTLASKSLDFTENKDRVGRRVSLPTSLQDGDYTKSLDVSNCENDRRGSVGFVLPVRGNDSEVSVLPPRRNTASGQLKRKTVIQRQTDTRSFRELKDAYTPQATPCPDVHATMILKCKAAEHQRGGCIDEQIEMLLIKMSKT